jgi:beta-lactamase regulating signal transducer with metallopeptidase domain
MFLLDHSLRIVIAAAAVGLVLVLFRVRSGSARHAAWTAILLAMLTMPVLVTVVPGIEVPVPSTLALDPGTIVRPSIEEITAPLTIAAQPAAQENERFAATAIERGGASAERLGSLNWTLVLGAVYLGGLLFFGARLAVGVIMARRLARTGTATPLAARAPVVESNAVTAPLTTGVLSPVILLPTTWRSWPQETLRAALTHEDAHVARRDCLILLLARVNQTLFWFHPLAWWLTRALAVNAEHACDETVVRTIGEPRRYAEILVEMARSVSRRRSRIAWAAAGIDGAGHLGARVDRLLRGDALGRMSLARRVSLAAACATVLAAAVACRQQIAAAPLRPDPEVAKTLAAQKERTERARSAASMTTDEAARLESSLQQNPSDLDARERLLTYYRLSERVHWNDKLSGIRRHVLWMIEHAPDTRMWIPVISPRQDAQGYEAAKRLWLERTAQQDVPVQVLANAAGFLSAHDKPLAEELLLRGRERDPESEALRAMAEPGIASPSWVSRLGELYGRAIVGNVDPATMTDDAEQANAPFAAEARRKLDATTDARILLTAARILTLRPAAGHSALGRAYLERALQLDPENAEARALLANAKSNERTAAIAAQLRAAGARDKFDEFSDTTYAAVSALPVADRLFYLPWAAESAYMRAESIEYTARDKPEDQKAEALRKARAGWERARQYAEDALTLAAANTTASEYGAAIYRSNVALGVLALKDGDRERAVEHMARAVTPSSEALLYSQQGLRGRLVEYLLREGERETVAAFLEKSAEMSETNRARLLKDAEQIRRGIMPQAFQYAEARR